MEEQHHQKIAPNAGSLELDRRLEFSFEKLDDKSTLPCPSERARQMRETRLPSSRVETTELGVTPNSQIQLHADRRLNAIADAGLNCPTTASLLPWRRRSRLRIISALRRPGSTERGRRCSCMLHVRTLPRPRSSRSVQPCGITTLKERQFRWRQAASLDNPGQLNGQFRSPFGVDAAAEQCFPSPVLRYMKTQWPSPMSRSPWFPPWPRVGRKEFLSRHHKDPITVRTCQSRHDRLPVRLLHAASSPTAAAR